MVTANLYIYSYCNFKLISVLVYSSISLLITFYIIFHCHCLQVKYIILMDMRLREYVVVIYKFVIGGSELSRHVEC